MNQDDENDELEDREFPDEADMDSSDEDEEAETRPCPRCHRPVYVEAHACPYCGAAILANGRGRKPLWMMLVVAACVIAMILYYVI